MMEQRNSLTVSQLNNYVKAVMERDDLLGSVAVSGEISNFKRHTSGHLYFTLKDEKSEIAAVMFRTSAARLAFAPANGMRVTVFGSVTVYEAAGRYQIYVGAMTNGGAGALYEQFKRLFESPQKNRYCYVCYGCGCEGYDKRYGQKISYGGNTVMSRACSRS